MKIHYVFILISILFIGACAKDSGIMIAKDNESIFDNAVCPFEAKVIAENKANSELYRMYLQGATGFVPVGALADEIEKQANKHCEKMGKAYEITKLSKSPQISYPGCFPKAEIEFICIPKPITGNFEDQLYIKLSNLKKLFENGTITKEEFEQQKAKILNP